MRHRHSTLWWRDTSTGRSSYPLEWRDCCPLSRERPQRPRTPSGNGRPTPSGRKIFRKRLDGEKRSLKIPSPSSSLRPLEHAHFRSTARATEITRHRIREEESCPPHVRCFRSGLTPANCPVSPPPPAFPVKGERTGFSVTQSPSVSRIPAPPLRPREPRIHMEWPACPLFVGKFYKRG